MRRRRPRIALGLFLAGCAALLIYCAVFVVGSGNGKVRSLQAEAQSTAIQVRTAFSAYRIEYGIPLTGDAGSALAILRGSNPKQIVFFEAPAHAFNCSGELIDPWGTPYRFDLTAPEEPRVWSCGKDRQDAGGAEGSDDVTSWR